MDARTAGQQLASALRETPDLAGVLVFADGLRVNGPDLVHGLTSFLPEGLPIAGGLGSDGTGQACAIGLYGPCLRMARSCRGGSVEFGQRRLVTRAQGHTVEEIDGQSALQLYRHYLGRYASGLPEAASHFPLTVFRHAEDTHGVIRYVLGEQTAEELEPVAAALPAGSALAGFYSFGEISSSPGQRCDMHNMTLTLAAVWETETHAP